MARQRHFRNWGQPGETIFVTTTVLDFVPVFRSHQMAVEMLGILAESHRSAGARLHAFVIMPEHLHFVSDLPQDMSASAFVGRIKSASAIELRPRLEAWMLEGFRMQQGLNRRQFWQRSFRSVCIDSQAIFGQKILYTHLNPVRRGLCQEHWQYRWSSGQIHMDDCWDPELGLPLEKVLTLAYPGRAN